MAKDTQKAVPQTEEQLIEKEAALKLLEETFAEDAKNFVLEKEKFDKEETISINQTKFNEVMKLRKEQIKKFKSLDKFNNGLKFTLHTDEAERIKKDEAFAKKTENWRKNLERDFYLEETVDVLSKIK